MPQTFLRWPEIAIRSSAILITFELTECPLFAFILIKAIGALTSSERRLRPWNPHAEMRRTGKYESSGDLSSIHIPKRISSCYFDKPSSRVGCSESRTFGRSRSSRPIRTGTARTKASTNATTARRKAKRRDFSYASWTCARWTGSRL